MSERISNKRVIRGVAEVWTALLQSSACLCSSRWHVAAAQSSLASTSRARSCSRRWTNCMWWQKDVVSSGATPGSCCPSSTTQRSSSAHPITTLQTTVSSVFLPNLQFFNWINFLIAFLWLAVECEARTGVLSVIAIAYILRVLPDKRPENLLFIMSSHSGSILM